MFWTNVAYAMGGAGGGAGAGGEAAGMASFLPIILMFAVFYFLLIRPQQKRTKEHKAMLSALKRGDEVITAGGIFGRIHEIADDYAILDVGGAKMKVLRSSISTLSGVAAKAQERKGKKDDSKGAKKDEPKDVKKDEPKDAKKDEDQQDDNGAEKDDQSKAE